MTSTTTTTVVAAAADDDASTVCVTLSDAAYWHRARRTIRDLRTAGEWQGALVLIAVDFQPPDEDLERDRVQLAPHFRRVDIEAFVAALRARPLSEATDDGREYRKLAQFEKLHAFQPWFAERWQRLAFFDAGLRVLAPLRRTLLALPWRGRFWAPDDTVGHPQKTFRSQLETRNWPELLADLERETAAAAAADQHQQPPPPPPPPLVDARPYFLNCVWLYDTSLGVTTAELAAAARRWPLWRTNEMGPMNVVLHFQRRLWVPFPEADDWVDGERRLFAWCDAEAGTWRSFGLVKYSCTLPFDADPAPW